MKSTGFKEMQAFLAKLTQKSQHCAACPETLHELQAGALTVEGYSSLQHANSGNLLILPCIAMGCFCPCFAFPLGNLTVHGFQTALILKALTMMEIPTEGVTSFSSFNWIALVRIASGYSIYKLTVRGCPDTRMRSLVMKVNQHMTLQTRPRSVLPQGCPARHCSRLPPRHSEDARGKRCAVPGQERRPQPRCRAWGKPASQQGPTAPPAALRAGGRGGTALLGAGPSCQLGLWCTRTQRRRCSLGTGLGDCGPRWPRTGAAPARPGLCGVSGRPEGPGPLGSCGTG